MAFSHAVKLGLMVTVRLEAAPRPSPNQCQANPDAASRVSTMGLSIYSRKDDGTPALRASSCMTSSCCLASSRAFFFSSSFCL
jgi:hypothetical protein